MGTADTVIPRVEERLSVDKETVVDGAVTVSTRTEVLDEIAEAQLERQTVEVTRIAMNIEVAHAPDVRKEGDVMIVPVLEERLVKRLFLVEEVHIRQHITSEPVNVPVSLRKQTVLIEQNAENKEN
ncbi:hypothetical protein ASG42_30170 [Rhizobium sp. Leaf391]|uniref:YsnF/AvaK domain-containing protein n=1 Tax=Rhizobium sp. Leaf391 TaxID=1736360 RepID=UPI0007138E5E|nr:YsnF/AvaK domain-containing protein [Rhizobium sp. Leaf391]KQS95070.1 hypothetical protein ASG42_30170 [Rhizobium sp. Leaf391]